ncbi:hypothetical protein [Paraburkholderia bannensis]|uniref:hypothetical protein n=1 Tax=Paraburkholderia bannensis TaxID=765414 RepID=UPI002AC34477|nr:hypothetical protein [Paraburkholderia bannensis]
MSNFVRPEITADLRNSMNGIGDILGAVFEGHGFALLVFDFGPGGTMNYISNAKREDMLIALREFIASHEGRAHDAPEDLQ